MNKLLIISEIHGSAQNIDVYKHFIQQWQRENIIFKIGLEMEGNISLYDGKISFEMVDFLRWLEQENIQWFSFDTYSGDHQDWNVRDKEMAESIKGELENSNVIAIMGNLHSKRKSFLINGNKHVPAASYFTDNVHIVGIAYVTGSYFNFGEKFFTQPYVPDQKKIDEIYTIENSRPITPLISF